MSFEARVKATQDLIREAGAHAPVSLALSLGVEDMVLLDFIHSYNQTLSAPQAGVDAPALSAPNPSAKIEAFVLDTGRLHEESYTLLASLSTRYPKVKIRVFFPQAAAIEQFVRLNGINGFYESIGQRKGCCEIRKVEPLRRALAPLKAWITGLRREQSPTRQDLSTKEDDTSFGLLKFNPLLDWSTDDVWRYVREHNVPTNALHDQGYPSIGCAPCTRAIQPGEDIRAGRWWWESADQKECGLHAQPK
ncbi:MAG: phosphoadenylyl-sulfate reductase [Pseudomonadota bacterium]